MSRHPLLLWIVGSLAVAGLADPASPQPPAGERLPANPVEVQTRGPVHEAMVQPDESKPMTPIPKSPPAPINEQPPDYKPEVEDSQWVPGYWAWDPDRQEFTWISGVYRNPPSGRKFVPGYWDHTADGWRWVAGFWGDANQPQVKYAPEPPAPLNVDPQTPAPDGNSTYVPGVWVYRDNRFLWRPGYWNPMQTGRVWVPPSYSWTPAGNAYVDGYWDYPLQDRGLLFAPATFDQPLPADYVYQPNYVVDPYGLLDSSYSLPGNPFFWFGNYAGPGYGRLGYRPWYNGLNRYNPAFGYYGLQNGQGNPNWLNGMQRTYAGRANGSIAGPPLSFAQQTPRNAMVIPLRQLRGNSTRIVAASPAQVNTQRTMAQQTRQLAQVRSQADRAFAGNGSSAGRTLNLAPLSAGQLKPQVLNFSNNAPARGANGPTIMNGSHLGAAPAHVQAAPRMAAPAAVHRSVNSAPSRPAPQPAVHAAHAANAHHASAGGHGGHK